MIHPHPRLPPTAARTARRSPPEAPETISGTRRTRAGDPPAVSKASQIRQPEGKRTDATAPASESSHARHKNAGVRKGHHPPHEPLPRLL